MITPIYAAALGLVLLALSVRVLLLRRRKRIAVGDGDDPELLRAMRAQANFIEYVPFTLLLLFFAESLGANTVLLHILMLALLIGRVLHGIGLNRVKEDFRFRVAGMISTFTALGAASLQLFWLSL